MFTWPGLGKAQDCCGCDRNLPCEKISYYVGLIKGVYSIVCYANQCPSHAVLQLCLLCALIHSSSMWHVWTNPTFL